MTLWTPANLATLPTHWWDAQESSTITISTGNSVSAWANKGSAGGTVTQATAASQPTRSTSSFGGRQALFFDGTDDFFASTFAVGAAFRLFAVINYFNKIDQLILGGANTFVPLASGPSSGSATNNQVWRVNNVNTIGPQTVWQNAVAASVGTRSEIWTQLTGGQRIFSIRNLPAFGGYRLFEGGNTVFRPNGSVAEILLVPEAGLTQADDDLITGYLAWRWGLEGALPADHPYKTAAPAVGPSANNATAASAFDLAGSSAAALVIAAQGASGLEITGAGSVAVRIAGTGAGSLPLGGSAQAASQAQASAAANGTLPLAGSAVTQVQITASASGALSLGGSAQASAAAIVAATATGTLPLGGAGTVTARIAATGAGTIDLGGASAVQVRIGAAGAGELPLAGAGAITTRIGAAGNGAIGLGGTSVAQAQIGAEAAGALALTGTATAADRARVPSLIFAVLREDRIFFIAREQRIFPVAREQRIFKLKRAA